MKENNFEQFRVPRDPVTLELGPFWEEDAGWRTMSSAYRKIMESEKR